MIPLAAEIDVGSLVVQGATLAFDLTRDYDCKVSVKRDLSVLDGATVTLGALGRAGRADVGVGGDMTVSGTGKIVIYAGESEAANPTWQDYKAGGSDITVGGNLVITNTASIIPHSAMKSGLSVVLKVGGNVHVANGASINATSDNGSYFNGFGWYGPYGKGFKIGYGGSHGGRGAQIGSSAATYGFAYAPFYPGSPGQVAVQGQGGGSVRLAVKGDLQLDGYIRVTGGKNNGMGNHAGSGGGIWITCKEFAAGAAGRLYAEGGYTTQHDSSCAGGGGRIAIMTGAPTDEQIDSLYETGTCDDLLVVAENLRDIATSPYPEMAYFQGGTNTEYVAYVPYKSHAEDGTGVLLKNSYGQVVVTVQGDVLTTLTDPQYGTSSVDTGDLTFTAPEYIYSNDGLSRYHCIGYEWSDTGGGSGNGETTEFTINMSYDTTVTWKWSAIQHKLRLLSGGDGTISGSSGEWYTEGASVTLTAVPSGDRTFDQWAGEFDYAGKANKSATLTVTMSEPREIFAMFKGGAARTVTWTGAAGDLYWNNPANWDSPAIPAAGDTAVVTNGIFWVKHPCDISLGAFVVSNAVAGFVGCQTNTWSLYGQTYTKAMLPCDRRDYTFKTTGDFTVGGTAKLYFGGIDQTNRMDLAVGGDMTLMGGTSSDKSRLQIHAGCVGEWTDLDNYVIGGGSLAVVGQFIMDSYSEFTPVANRRSGSVVPLKAGTVYIGPNAVVNARCRGFGKSFHNPGTGWTLTRYGHATTGSNNFGGTYGGQGGYNATESFGYEAAPFYPGGSGNCPAHYTAHIFSGGGAVRIDADSITLDGTINANAHGEYCVGGGSGGGVWLTCNKFFLGANGYITACHDDGSWYYGTGGGGGGRISICVKFSDAHIQKLYRTGGVRNMTVTPLSEITAGSEKALQYGNVWPGRYSVALGTGPWDGMNGTDGTAVLVEAPPYGSILIMR